MNHLFYNHFLSGSIIILLGLFILFISIWFIYQVYKEQKNESLISMIFDNLFGFLLGPGPTGMTFGIYFSAVVIVIGGWILFYGQNHV
jgi:hypothetical protein